MATSQPLYPNGSSLTVLLAGHSYGGAVITVAGALVKNAAWRTLPSWHLVATADQAIHPDAQRFIAQRTGAQTVEIDASHAVALSQPDVVTDLILAAARAQVQ